MNLGQAIESLKVGERVRRKGWNGKGMWLHLIEENSVHFEDQDEVFPISRWVGIKADYNQIVPWQPSTGDMLAEDWEVVE